MIWLALLVVAVLALVLLSAPSLRRPPGVSGDPAPGPDTGSGIDLLGRSPAHEAEETRRYAGEVAVAAGRAAQTAQRRRAEWLAAQDAVEAAWQAFDRVDLANRRLGAAVAFPLDCIARTPAEFAERERYLHRAATAACRRKELPVSELVDALAHRNGWDPRRHPLEQEVAVVTVSRAHLLAAYRRAAATERSTWHLADVAAAAARSLRDEAFAAAVAAHRTGTRVHADVPTGSRWIPAGVRRPRLATR